MTINQFGWKPSSLEKQASNALYLFNRLGIAAPAVVEKTFDWNADWLDEYDQGNIGSCVGYSCSWMMSYYNKKLYNAYRLYKQAQKDDGDGSTTGDQDGAYLWSAGDVLRKRGHALYKTDTFIPAEGIINYYWCKSIDDIRTACDQGRPPVFGIPWFSEFNNPRTINGEFWIGERTNWGSILGGHAIWDCAISDSKTGAISPAGAIALRNSWGRGWASGKPVWISYKSIQRLFSYGSECMVVMDIAPEPPPPPPDPEPEDTMTVTAIVDGKEYGGTLERVT